MTLLCDFVAGISSLFVSFLVGMYYNTIMAWIMWYLFNSFQDPLPWSQCPLNQNRTGTPSSSISAAHEGLRSPGGVFLTNVPGHPCPSQARWKNVLGAPLSTTSGTERPSTRPLPLTSRGVYSGGSCCRSWLRGLCFMFAASVGLRHQERCERCLKFNVCVCVCCTHRAHAAFLVQAVYITSTLPYLVLTIFLVRGLTLKGSVEGLKFLFTPKVSTRVTH